MSRSDLVDLTLQIHVETRAAWGVSDTGKAADMVWLPKSQVEAEELPSNAEGRTAVFTMPEWLAIEKELI